MPIRVLSEQLASQIAAGEVVERPASVVKELIENAIDAGATTINVTTRGGGLQAIQIADNGSGIGADEVETAFLRHATSKLNSAESLTTIATLGFRGEALAAIASVSQLTVISRDVSAESGIRLVLEGGKLVSRDVVGAPTGTVISIENLFFNTPARLEFQKTEQGEKRAVSEIVTRFALAYPNIRFRLTHDTRMNFQSTGNGNLRDALIAVYGVETARQFIELAEVEREDGSKSSIKVSGFVSPASLHRSNRSHITLFVNGRWIKDTRLTFAIIESYHTLMPKGRYPLAVVFIEVPYDAVDVNVHPMKTEVRFRKAGSVFGAVQRTVRAAVLASAPVRSFAPRPFDQLTGPRTWNNQRATDWETYSEHADTMPMDLPRAQPQTNFEPNNSTEQPTEPVMDLGGEKLPIMRVVGQVGAAFIITEGPQGMYLIDQHAAHERILYEQFLAAWGQNGVASQQLVSGLPVQLTPAQNSLLSEHLSILNGLGFSLEPFGPNTIMVRAVPALLAKADPEQALRLVIDDLERDAQPMQDKIEKTVIMRVCKSASIKAGQILSPQETTALVHQLEACEMPHTCPHGRPTLIHLSVAQLAREFGRT